MLHRTRKFADKVIRRIISVVPTRSLEGWEKRHEKKVIESVEKLVPHVPADGFFLDIGCNIGSFSRHLRARRPNARGTACTRAVLPSTLAAPAVYRSPLYKQKT